MNFAQKKNRIDRMQNHMKWLDLLPIHNYLIQKYSRSNLFNDSQQKLSKSYPISDYEKRLNFHYTPSSKYSNIDIEMSNIYRRANQDDSFLSKQKLQSLSKMSKITAMYTTHATDDKNNTQYKNNQERFDYYMLEAYPILDQYRHNLEVQRKLSFVTNLSCDEEKKDSEDAYGFISKLIDKYLMVVTTYFPEEADYVASLRYTPDEEEELLEQSSHGLNSSTIHTSRDSNQNKKRFSKLKKEMANLNMSAIHLVDKENEKQRTNALSRPKKFCKYCQDKPGILILDICDNNMICEQCGTINEHETSTDQVSFKDIDRVNISTKYQYDRVTHFKDCMNQFQGKQNATIDLKVYDDLRHEFLQHGLIPGNYHVLPKEIAFSKITKEHIMLFLKETKHTKHYEDVVLLHHEFTGIPPPDIRHLENILLQDFDELTNLYDEKFRQNDRKNFINTQYILYQLLKRHKFPCKKEDFNILKTIDRKYYHDNITKTLFEELGWNFNPTF